LKGVDCAGKKEKNGGRGQKNDPEGLDGPAQHGWGQLVGRRSEFRRGLAVSEGEDGNQGKRGMTHGSLKHFEGASPREPFL